VAFFAVGAYSWAIFGSPQANAIFGHGFPLAPALFYAFLLVGLAVAALTGVVLGLSRLAESHPEIVSVDVNPLVVVDGRPVAVDALVEVEQ
jgi:branched-chain amino acid transport system permease protein